jgi:hypothetical protein
MKDTVIEEGVALAFFPGIGPDLAKSKKILTFILSFQGFFTANSFLFMLA